MPLPFNKTLDLKLLKLVKENPILYNTKHSKYLDFDSREVVWQKIGDALSRPAVQFAGIQCQVQLGDYNEKKHKTGFIENFEEYLPAQYLNAWNIEKKIVKEFSQHQGLSELEAKFLYIKTARALPTYGVTFFLVKEKQKDKKKLVPRLLGINSHAILRLDEVTKEILEEWPLTHVKTYHAGKSQTFTLNFGDYSNKEYSVKTQDCYRIRDILEAYIDIIRRRMMAKPCRDPGESMAVCHDNVQQGTSHLIQHVSNNPSKVVTETFVGPNKLITGEHGSQPQSGTMITTVQQLVVKDHLQNQQMALKGEMPLRGDMSKECIKKLNRMNSNSVKIVGLLTDPTEQDYEEIQNIVRAMKEDFPDVDKGVKETADKQAIEDARKMLLDELHDLNNFLKKLDAATAPQHFDREGGKDAAENIADLTTQIYFSLDPKTRRRSELIRRSRNKMKAGEKSEQSMRRASFLAAANSAQHALNNAEQILNEDYSGPKPDAAQRKMLEKALKDKMGKLNAAIALYLTAHSDPENIDYASAINSMNAINELMPEIAKDTQILASTLAPSSREQLLDDMQELCDATKAVCGTSSAEDHTKMQEATNQYAGIAGKLISTFARGTNADKEHEIIELAKDVGNKTSLLLVSTNELTCQAASEPAAADVDTAGVRVAGAATDLIACARLTAPAIHEPHCQSALTAACEGISSSVHQLEGAWRPLLEDQTRQPMSDQLHSRVVDVGKALERLKDAYANLGGVDDDDSSAPAQERKRLKFITTMNGAKGKLQGVEDLWNQQSATGVPSEREKAEAQRRMEQSMAQLNAAIAALAAATADRENPDYATAELAIATISELMPQIVKDAETVSCDKDEATRNAMQKNIRALCDATRKICEGDGHKHGQGEEAADFAAASGKLLFLISPGADKGRQKFIIEETAIAQDNAAKLVAGAHRLQDQVPEHIAAELGSRAARTTDAANALGAVAQVTAPSISSPRCQDALSSAASQLLGAADSLTAACQHQAHEQPELQAQCAVLTDTHQRLADSLHRLTDVCNMGHADKLSTMVPSAQQEKKRLQFVKSTAAAKQRLDAAAQQLNKPMLCQMMEEGSAVALGEKLNDRIAQLNAAVAALAAATADRENPDYEAAEKAINKISQIMPYLIQDSQTLCGTKSDAEQAAMMQELRALCEATQELCDNAGTPQGLNDAIAKYTDASTKLVYCATPRADNEMENEILGLTTDACGKASELLSQVQQLTEHVADAEAAAELDRCGASAADAAQALLTVAQTTASTIDNPQCKDQLISAAEKLRRSADELTASCEPHTAQGDARRQLGSSHRQLADSLDKLVNACRKIPEASQSSVSQPQKERQRLKFMNSLTGARNRLYDSEQQLKQPLTKHQLKPEQAAALEQRLSQRLAQLNAAVAALAAAKADPENPDWIAAEQAVKEISELMPQIVQDSRQLSSTKDGAGQAAMLDQLKALCHASRSLCENSETDPKISTNEFHKAASKLKFIVSPTVDKAKEKQVVELSKTACEQAGRLALNAKTACPAQVPLASRLQEAAGTLDSVVQATSSSPSDPRCSEAVTSAAENVQNCAEQLTSSCEPQLMQRPEVWQQLLGCQRQLTNDLDKLVQAYQSEHGGTTGPGSDQQEKQRLKFINSASGAKDRLNAAEKLLKEPLVCQLMKEDDGAALQRRLAARVAQLNAAVAALTAATADREHPDYVAADQAIQRIAQLTPQVVEESRTLCGTKSDAEQAAMMQELRALCEATQELCQHAGQAQGVSDAAAKFSAASGKLVYVVSPKKQDAHEKQVVALAATSCGKASELLSQVQQLTEHVADAEAAAELDRCGASAADAAQALLTVAQTTAPTINDPQCQKQVISAAEKLRRSADELTASCEPHTAQLPDARRQLGSSHRQLADSLDKLIQACRSVPRGNTGGITSEEQEQQRLKFINSASGAKSRLNAAEKLLKEPLVCQLMKEDDGAALQRRLAARVAQLNAAVAALTAATADREHPDYAAADQAIQRIAQLTPQVVEESRTLCGTKSDAEQAAMMQELRALCEATQELCQHAGQAQGVSDAAAKFSAASGKLVYVVSPKKQDAHEKQVVALAATSCGKASELLSQVQQLTEHVADADAAAELDRCGASAADAAQALLTVAQTTAPTISDPQCQKQVISAAEKLRRSADELTASCEPHTAQLPDARRQLGSSHRQLADSLDKLMQACQSAPRGGISSEEQEQQRLKFINSASGAKGRLNAAEKLLKEPLVCQLMKEDDGAALQRRLAARVAQLNAAVAALTAATADREHPDYVAADQAIQRIAQLTPQVVEESRTLCGTKSDAEQAAMMQELRALCEATQELCQHAGQAQGVSDAAAKFSAASGKLVYVVSPKKQDAHEKQVVALAATSCGKASELLSQVQQLTEHVADADAAAALDRCGASAADAAQALLTVAQTTAPTINDPQCQKQLISAAEKLRRSADELTASCEPHTAQLPDARRQLGSSHRQLADSLDKLIQACRSVPRGGISSEEQEQQRLKFINSASGAKGRLNAAEKLLKEPLVCQLMKEDDGAALQRRLAARVAQLNAAVAALTAATADREHPDYAAADQAIQRIAQLTPQVVEESRTLCGTKSDAEQAAMMQELRALCEATQELCQHAGQAQGVSDAAAKFSAASGKLVYVVSPKKQDAHEKQVVALAATSCGKASELLSQVQQLTEHVADADAAAELDRCGASAADAAQALLTVAQTTAPTISDTQCQKQVISAAEKLRRSADELTASCEPLTAQLPDARRQLGSSHRQLADSLDKLMQACQSAPRGAISSEEQEQQRLKFINSASGAKDRLNAAEKLLKEPLVCQLMKEDDGAALQRRLAARVAQLNAAVAALTAATADREHPDYVAADQAIQRIAQLTPQVVEESRTLCGTKSDAEQAAMMQELRALCEATQELCQHAGQAQGVSDAAAKFSAASGKLVYVVSPKKQDAHEKQVVALAATSCGKASELLSQVQQLTEHVADADAAAELDRCGASAADAAQALLTVAQTTAPTISDPQCQKQLISAAEKLRRSADELTASCEPHTAQLPDARRQLGSSHRQLADSLDKLIQACRSVPRGNTGGITSEEQEQQRLKFINSASGAKSRLNAAEKLLKEPLVCQLMKEDDGAALQRRLAARVAQLNAAVAALTAATADREHPDYVAADQAIQRIAQLTPQVVEESRTLCGTKSDAEQAAMMQELRALCEATQELCQHAGQAQGVSDAAAKFSAASGKLVYVVSPKKQDAHEKQVVALAATSCGKASELLSQVQQLTEHVADADAAAELDRCGASAADAAQALLTVAQTTAPTISDPQCQKQVISAAEKLRRSADELTASCEPHTAQLPDARRQLGSSHRQLADSLDKLIQACRSVPRGGISSEEEEQQRLKFINSASGAKDRLNAAEKLLKEPLVCQLMKEDDGAALQRRLAARVAQLNAAVAALTAATADREHPDYVAADQAIQRIAQLTPQVVEESRTLCGTKSDAEQAAMMQELRALCEATQELCQHAGQAQGVSDAAAKFSAASGKLVYVVSPKKQDAYEKQLVALAATSCGKASELLSQVQQLTEHVADADAAAELDRCGASAADAAQALLTVAQTTAPTINDPQCQKQVISAAEKLRRSADELTASCEPHTAQLPDARRQLGSSHRQLADSLDKLIQACRSVPRGGISPEEQEQQRLKFINSASGAKGRLNAAEKLLKEPLVCQLMKEDDGAALQRRLAARVAQLNAAVAALTAATADREHPDYVAADQAIQRIAQLTPQVVEESRTLCGTKSDAEQAAMMQELRALCEATQELCQHAGQAQGVSDAAAKFSAASGKLVYVVSPKKQDAHEKQVGALAATSCGKASELLSQVQQLTEHVADADAAAELDRCGASAADAAQALLTVAQTTAPTISDPQCQKQVISAAEKLRRSADELTASCEPHTAQLPDARRQLSSSHQQLADSLDKLIKACQSVPRGGISSEEQEQHRLKFINSASGAKGRLNAAEKLLKEPLVCQLMKEDDGAALQRRLAARVAQLNAAVAALTAATADREHPDYVAADQAIQRIAQLTPQVVEESRTLCGTKSDAEQAAMMQELRALCEATQELCQHAGQAQGVSDAAAKFSAASGKLVYVVSPKKQDAHEKQVVALAATSCGKASELLSQVQQLTEHVADADAAAELDRCGASAADAAQALLTVVQTTAPTISDPQCQKQVILAAEKLRRSADELTASCEPHTAQLPDARRQLGSSHRQLADSLDKLMQACQSASGADVVLSPQQEQQRLKFVSSISGAKGKLDTAEQQMRKPVVAQRLQQADSSALQQQLSRRLAQLNAALAALAAATTDGKNPDYPAAERAVTTVIELMPQIVQDSHRICSTKEPAEQAAMMQELKELCEASRTICDCAGHPIKLNEATAKLADASSKLLHIVSPEDRHTRDASRGLKPAVQARKPAVPVRDPKHTVAKAVRAPGQAHDAQAFLDAMRAEESGGYIKPSKSAEEEKLAYQQFADMIENAEMGLKSAEEGLQVLYKAKNVTVAGQSLPALEVVKREQHMEDTLAKAGIEVAALVSANYADKLDYKAAMQPTVSLTESVRSVINDGSAICSSMTEEARKKFLEDMLGLCQATKLLCDSAKSEKEKLNDAAIVFGDQSVKLLRVVSSNVDPALEKEAISRAKAIGDAASRLAMEATNLASSASEAKTPGTTDSQVRDICAAGTSCVDSAGKLVYTTKLVAPTIHHETCQDALVSSADHLSSSLTTFTNTLAPLASTKQPNVQKLLEEAAHLEKLVEKLRKDVRAGKLGKRREVDPIDLGFPLRNLAEKIVDNAKNMIRDDTLSPPMKKEYSGYCGRLEEALRALDLANARYQRAPHDKNKREELEMMIDELQMTVLQSRPSKVGQEQNNIVDFRDFLQDLVNESGDLQKTVRKNEGPIGKKTSEDIKMLCSKISEDATKLLNPTDNFGGSVTVMNTVDDILDIDLFGQECDNLVKEINNSIQGVQDQKTRQELLAKSLPMLESCHLLRFATKSHIMATQSTAYNEVMQDLDNFKSTTMATLAEEAAKKSVKQTKAYSSPLGSQCCMGRATSRLVAAGQRAARGEPRDLLPAVARVALSTSAQPGISPKDQVEDIPKELANEEPVHKYIRNLNRMTDLTKEMMVMACEQDDCTIIKLNPRANKYLRELYELDYKLYPRKTSTQVLNSDDIDRLLLCPRETVEGTPKQLEEKLQQLSSKLSSMGSTVVLSASSPSSLSRTLHAAAQAAVQLANTARALADRKKPAQCKMIEDAAHEMCLSTYSLLKTSELVCQEPNHHDSKRKLLEACRHLNDSINKLVRSTGTGQKVTVGRACGEAGRSLALQRGMLQAAPRPPGATSYALSLHTMKSQRDVLKKLNSDEAMSREEFLKSMNYAVTAVNNSAECAAQAAYLISVSDQDKSIGLNGPVDVGKLHNTIQTVEDTCISLITTNDDVQIAEEKKALKNQVKDLEESLKDAIEKTKEGELKNMLKECTDELMNSHRMLDNVQDFGDRKKLTSRVADLMLDVSNVACVIEHPDLVPVATDISADTQKHVDEIVKNSLTLLSNTEELVKQVKAAPEEPETMKWVMFNKRKDVLDAFENLLKSVKASGQRVNLLEAEEEEPEEEKKSYVETQFDLASKWLSKPICKPVVKTKGQEAVRNLMDVANKVAEDLQGSDKEDMKNLIVETEQLLKECSQKYDQEQYSVLLERVRELKKGVSRGVVSKLVQDFMQAEEPLADLDLIADYEKDESKRKFMLEKKIAELLAQLGRVTSTARLVAHTHAHRSDDIQTSSQQTELLAPLLVKAAQERISRPDDKAVIENYKSLLAKYAESLSKIRDLCDQSVDPMEFVQTAGETIERMREESSKHNDPVHNVHTSTAISKLANRVIHVGISSSTARRDPELQRALAEAQHQLAAATPAPDTRASKMPDFNDTTAKILQATDQVESLLCGETIFKQQPTQDQPIFNEARNLHEAIRDWSSRDNEIVAVAKRMAVLMAKLSNFMNNDKQREVLATSKSIVTESHEVARLAKKLAHECTDHRIKTNLLQTCERIPTISGQLKMLTTVKGFSLGRHGTQEDKEAMDMLVGNAQSLMLSIQDVVKGAASASVKIMSQRGPRMKWKRKTVY